MSFRLPRFSFFFLLFPAFYSSAETLRLSEDGKARYGIVLGGEPATKAEQFAYVELREHLNRVIGAERKNHERFSREMSFEGLHTGERNIYLGWTDFAREQGVDPESLGEEEYIIRAVGENIMIVGGRSRGTLYGVYDFLENQTGVVFAAPGETVIPNKPTLEIPKNLDIHRQPGIASRGTSRSFDIFLPNDDERYATTLWRVRNRENQPADINLSQANPPLWMREMFLGAKFQKEIEIESSDLPLVDWSRAYPLWMAEEFGGFKRIPHLMHNVFTLVPPEEWQQSHPEFFSMRDGKWMENLSSSVATRGDLNYSNKDSRPIAAGNLLEEIELAHKANRRLGDNLQDTFFFTQMDNMDFSQDPDTRRLIQEKYGEHSGVMLEYVNDVAGTVAEKFPDVFIKTFAYMFTMNPPRNIRAADNVIVQWINWYGGPYGYPDLTRSLAHEDNTLRANSLREWGELSKQIGIWDYYYLPTEFPSTNFNRLAGDFPLFDASGVELIFVQIDQAEELGAIVGPWAHGQFFFELDTWLAYQLMNNPKADAAALADRFLTGYYGAAAPAMREIFTQLREGDAMPRERLSRRARRFHKFPYLTPAFYLALDQSLAQAEEAVAGDPELAQRVRRHRVKSDMSLLVHWNEIASQLPDGEPMPFNRSEVIARLRDNGTEVIAGDYESAHNRDRVQANLNQRLDYYTQAKPPEEGLADGDWVDIPSWKFIPTANWALRDAREYRQDPLSMVGRAEVYSGDAMKTIDEGIRIGFHGDGFEKVVPLKDLKESGYTLIKVGQTSLSYSSQVWVQDPRFVVDIDLLPIRPGGAAANVVEVFVSLRLAPDKKSLFLDGVQLKRVSENALDSHMTAFLETMKEKEAIKALLEKADRVGLLPLTWAFHKDPEAKESGEALSQVKFDIAEWEKIRVLEPWTAQAAGQNYHGVAWYAVDYKISASDSDKPYLLQFPSVDGTCQIWVNGQHVADKPEGVAWDESFTVRLREGLVPGEINRIALRVEKNEFVAGVVGRPVLWQVGPE